MRSTVAELVTEALRRADALTPAEFAEAADDGETVVVDLREAEERVNEGSIHGSIHIPRGMLEFRADPTSSYHDERLRPSKRVLLHSASGGRSALAAETLAGLGYSDVAHLAGGIRAWVAAGYPVFGRQPVPY